MKDFVLPPLERRNTAVDATPFLSLMATFCGSGPMSGPRDSTAIIAKCPKERIQRPVAITKAGVAPERIRVPHDILTRMTKKPTARVDAVLLHQWVSTAVQEITRLKEGGVAQEEITGVVERTVPMLCTCLHEIVRQSSCHCVELGLVLEKLWRTYVDLIDRTLKDLNKGLKKQEEHIGKLNVELERVREEMAEMRSRHPAHLEQLKSSLETKFAQRHQEHYDRIALCSAETMSGELLLRQRNEEIQRIFPRFHLYRDALPIVEAPCQKHTKECVSALARDIERLYHGFPSSHREQLRRYIAPLLEYSSSDIPLLQKQWQENAAIIADLQESC